MNQPDVLPDSRKPHIFTPKGAVMGPMGWMVPVYCANCGKEGGLVPQENMTFAFWLCTPCYEKHGAITGTMAVPDEVFWAQVQAEQMEKYGHELSNEELARVAAEDSSPLATLLHRR